MTDRNNENLKRIVGAMRVGAPEVRDILALAGVEIGRDRAQRWLRSPSAGPGRYTAMTDREFDSFCEGFVRWCHETE